MGRSRNRGIEKYKMGKGKKKKNNNKAEPKKGTSPKKAEQLPRNQPADKDIDMEVKSGSTSPDQQNHNSADNEVPALIHESDSDSEQGAVTLNRKPQASVKEAERKINKEAEAFVAEQEVSFVGTWMNEEKFQPTSRKNQTDALNTITIIKGTEKRTISVTPAKDKVNANRPVKDRLMEQDGDFPIPRKEILENEPTMFSLVTNSELYTLITLPIHEKQVEYITICYRMYNDVYYFHCRFHVKDGTSSGTLKQGVTENRADNRVS